MCIGDAPTADLSLLLKCGKAKEVHKTLLCTRGLGREGCCSCSGGEPSAATARPTADAGDGEGMEVDEAEGRDGCDGLMGDGCDGLMGEKGGGLVAEAWGCDSLTAFMKTHNVEQLALRKLCKTFAQQSGADAVAKATLVGST